MALDLLFLQIFLKWDMSVCQVFLFWAVHYNKMMMMMMAGERPGRAALW